MEIAIERKLVVPILPKIVVFLKPVYKELLPPESAYKKLSLKTQPFYLLQFTKLLFQSLACFPFSCEPRNQ
jgi:hypothetical protein